MRTKEKETLKLPEGHEARFEARLDEELHGTKVRRLHRKWIGMAATLLLLLGLYGILDPGAETPQPDNQEVVATEDPSSEQGISLGDLSPELQQIETYYVANINMELAGLPASSEHKALIDAYMEKLQLLNKDYRALQQELNEDGPNDQVITALIQNLQMRLDLLYNLKEEVNQFNQIKSSHHENGQII